VQLRKLAALNARRKEIADLYTESLRDVGWIQLPPGDTPDSKSSWHIYCIQTEYRDQLMESLQEKGISTGVHYRPIHMYKCYGEQSSLPRAERAFRRIISLPMHPGLLNSDVEQIVDSIRAFSPFRSVRPEKRVVVPALAR